ncbi:putative periplasmic binding protein of transport system [Klebsiella variicola]|nr:putative periplasmic binding protein of transport system [Klebsiella variicola]
MLNAGLIPLIVVDQHKAVFWKQVFPKIQVHDNVVLRDGGNIAWAVRKDSPAAAGGAKQLRQKESSGHHAG